MSGHRQPRRVSVVIPTFNRAVLLRQTIDAVLAQSVPADEIIIVDDGSTDGTAAMVEGLAPAMRLLRQANAGDLAARNAGLAQARGELVAFCDSDDLWRPGFLAAMQALWQAEPRLVAGFGNFRIIRNGAWLPDAKFGSAPPGFWDGLREVGPGLSVFDTPIVDRLIRFQLCFPSALVVDRNHMRGIGGWDESVGRTVGTDFATMLRLAEHAPIGVVQAPLVGIRKHAGNYSADVQAMNLGDALILEHVLARRPARFRRGARDQPPASHTGSFAEGQDGRGRAAGTDGPLGQCRAADAGLAARSGLAQQRANTWGGAAVQPWIGGQHGEPVAHRQRVRLAAGTQACQRRVLCLVPRSIGQGHDGVQCCPHRG